MIIAAPWMRRKTLAHRTHPILRPVLLVLGNRGSSLIPPSLAGKWSCRHRKSQTLNLHTLSCVFLSSHRAVRCTASVSTNHSLKPGGGTWHDLLTRYSSAPMHLNNSDNEHRSLGGHDDEEKRLQGLLGQDHNSGGGGSSSGGGSGISSSSSSRMGVADGGFSGVIRNLTFASILSNFLEILKPDILTRRKGPTRVGPTAWLDGLRGMAAFSVCCMHLTVYTHAELEMCYGEELPNGRPNTSIAAWPILRLPFTGGHFAVTLFFVISGYVVPRRLISLLHEGRRDDFLEAVNSAMFRRPGRLILPVAWSTLFLAIVMGHLIPIPAPFPHYKENIFYEAWNWIKEMGTFANFFRQGPLFTWYNFHTWTIPVEFRGSMFLFVWLFMLHQIPNRPRVILTVAFTIYLGWWTPGGWYACFFAGMVTSELDMLHADGDPLKLPWDSFAKWWRSNRTTRQVILHVMLFIGLYFASQPSSDSECDGWKTLNYWIPAAYGDGPPGNVNYRWYYYFVGSWLTLVAVKEIAWVRCIFESAPAQYLGKHSFALYLIHGPMIGLFSERLFYLTGVKTPIGMEAFVRFSHLQDKWKNASWWPFPDDGPTGLEPNFLVCVALSLPVFLYVAEIGTKVFDTPSVKLTNWAWKKFKTLR